jgi:uncharacterized protein YbjT (DUF2867 family)
MSRILVIGASGTVGSGVAALLKQQGHQIRTTTGKAAAATADKVHVNLDRGDGVREAFEGVDRAFLLSPSGYADQHRILSPLIAEATRRGLKKVVLMSAFGADASDEAPLRRAELELERSGLTYNIIRPNWFMQNFNTFWVQGIREQGVLGLPVGDAKTSFIDARDISAVAARLLTSDDLNNRAFNLSGPESIGHAQVASAIAEVTGKQVKFVDIEPAQLKQGLLGAGLPADYAEFLVTIMGYLKAGYNAAVTGDVKLVLGREPIGFQQYAKDFREAWV